MDGFIDVGGRRPAGGAAPGCGRSRGAAESAVVAANVVLAPPAAAARPATEPAHVFAAEAAANAPVAVAPHHAGLRLPAGGDPRSRAAPRSRSCNRPRPCLRVGPRVKWRRSLELWSKRLQGMKGRDVMGGEASMATGVDPHVCPASRRGCRQRRSRRGHQLRGGLLLRLPRSLKSFVNVFAINWLAVPSFLGTASPLLTCLSGAGRPAEAVRLRRLPGAWAGAARRATGQMQVAVKDASHDSCDWYFDRRRAHAASCWSATRWRP
uniref:Uncharacterized protein n=1 Tax=Oryza meridionalis TaxID=40149 RepID=A0A0E0D5M3_9ORYZ